MSSVLAQMSRLERAARHAWLANAVDQRHGRCSSCGRTHDENGKPLLVARQPRRDYECLPCWDARQ